MAEPTLLEARLPNLQGAARLDALVSLTNAYRSSNPARALELGNQGIVLADSISDSASKVDCLNESGWALMEMGRYDEAMARAREAEGLAQEKGLRSGLARARNNQGVIHRRVGEYAEAIDNFRRALTTYQELGDRAAMATSLNNISVVLGFDLGDYDRSLESQLAALRIREDFGDPSALYQSYNTLGVVYHNLGDQEKALQHLTRALEGWRSVGAPPRIAAALGNLAEVYAAGGELQRALEAQLEALAIRESLSSPSGVAFSEESIGNILVRLGRSDEARPHLMRSLSTRRSLGERKNTATSLLGVARLERLEGDWASAGAAAESALDIASDIAAMDVERTAYLEISLAREGRRDYRGALDAFRRWSAVGDSLFSAARAQRVTALDAEFQVDRAQREIERLRAEARLSAATAQRRTAQLIAAILLALVLILLYGRHVAKGLQRELAEQVNARTAELSEANQRLEDLSLTDSLTGLRNRRYLFQTIESELAASLRAYRDSERTGAAPEASDVVFYLLDIDDFKSVNDEHGHAAGDRVLEQVARVLEETGRASDVVVRWGGEEFLILSRQADRAGAAVFAQRVRDAVRDHVFVAEEGVTLRRTCSVGFAPFPFVTRDPRSVSWDQVVGLADQAAYLAKRSGRDAWVGVHANDHTPPEAVRSDAATLELLVAEGVLDLVSSMDPETRRRLLGDRARESRRNA
jgi:diguanylate cyclase (GGDEF)-like protein